MAEIVTSAFSLLGKAAAAPIKDAALRRPQVIATLKKLRLDPKQPPRDFHSLYAYTLVESLYGRPDSLLRVFKDEYIQQSFYRSFADDDWSRLEREISVAVERNRETGEFGHLPYDLMGEVSTFISDFHRLVSRSRMAYETRLENKINNVSEMLDQVLKTRHEEEEHRQAEDPERADSSPAERLKDDARDWFLAVGYRVRKEWRTEHSGVALLVEIPQRRRGKFDVIVALCVDGELAPYHLETLQVLIDEEEAAEGWGIAQLRVSQAARRKANQSNGDIYCYSFDELIDLEADFEPYIDWLEQEVRDRHIDTRFVPLSCRKEEIDPRTEKAFETSAYEWRDGGLDNYVDAWLADPAKKHLSILGEFGMGKSWFALHLAGRLAAGWKDAKTRGVARPRIPLVIPLRDYAKQTSVAALLSEFFFHKHRIEIRNYDVFRILNQMGRFLLIFDGFDEMASRTDRNTRVSNFWELAKVVEPGAKVLLSSRTEYFPEAKEARDLFGARVTSAATAVPSEGPTFEIVELVPFDDEQIRLMLGHLLTPEKLEVAMENEGVRDLMRRPVMSELVIDALPEIERGAVINLARIYLYAIKRKMDRDVSSERTFTSRADKLFFLCEVAWEMIRTNQLSLNYKEFPERLRSCFGPAVQNSKDLDYWEQDMRNQSMLVRNSRGDYGPSHKSLLEFLIAFRFAAELGLLEGDFLRLIPGAEKTDGESYSWSRYFASRSEDLRLPNLSGFEAEDAERLAENFGSAEYNPVVFDFLATMIKESSDYQEILIRHIRSTASLADPRSLGGNCANLLAQAGGSLAGADLSGADLKGLGYTGDSHVDISLEGANLSGADLNRANIAYLNKRRANFREARLRGSGLLQSRVSAQQVVAHDNGAITAHLSAQRGKRPWMREDHRALHWPSGDIRQEPVVVHLTPDSAGLWTEMCGVFNWTDDTWGYSDVRGSVIVSSATGEVIKQITEICIDSIRWGDERAFLVTDGSKGELHWKIVDHNSKKLASVRDDFPDLGKGIRVRGMVATSQGVNMWASSESETWIYEMTSETDGFREVMRLPVGTSHAVEGVPPMDLMADDENVYLRDTESRCVVSSRRAAGDALEEMSSAHFVSLSPDNRYLVVGGATKLAVWEIESEGWRKLWARPLSSAVSTPPAIMADGSQMMIALDSGEFAVWKVRDGQRLAVITFNPHLDGACFSRNGDLEECEQESIALSGGVFDA
ncbi:NACHT domain-containing protein OS=Streptomyces rimosus subsp. rimosus (strain ATCC/ DSM 40260 / JCM 4667 / NRRL 2234) OX=1265868 GN=SRIM_020230 PE=4 SV=1 [Streptomyces rimosus subsp. rimosus]